MFSRSPDQATAENRKIATKVNIFNKLSFISLSLSEIDEVCLQLGNKVAIEVLTPCV